MFLLLLSCIQSIFTCLFLPPCSVIEFAFLSHIQLFFSWRSMFPQTLKERVACGVMGAVLVAGCCLMLSFTLQGSGLWGRNVVCVCPVLSPWSLQVFFVGQLGLLACGRLSTAHKLSLCGSHSRPGLFWSLSSGTHW